VAGKYSTIFQGFYQHTLVINTLTPRSNGADVFGKRRQRFWLPFTYAFGSAGICLGPLLSNVRGNQQNEERKEY
jgi:hypothetical protein